MMNNELIAKCRFYKGEDSCPDNVSRVRRGRMFWRVEQQWVADKGQADDSALSLLREFNLDDASLKKEGDSASSLKVPQNLRAVLFKYLCHYSDESPDRNASFFMKVVIPEYIRLALR